MIAVIAWAFPVKADTANQPIEASITPKTPITSVIKCSCVNYAKWIVNAPINESWGNADKIQPKSMFPGWEGFVLTTEGGGHIAHYVRYGDALYLDESNFEHCKLTQRVIYIDDPVIRGYINLLNPYSL